MTSFLRLLMMLATSEDTSEYLTHIVHIYVYFESTCY